MRAKEMRELSKKELLKLKKELEFNKIKASSIWGIGKVKDREAGMNVKDSAKKGNKTSLQKNIRINIARINTILNERR